MFKVAAFGLASIAASLVGRGAKSFYHQDPAGRTDYTRATKIGSSSIAQHNRWTGEPHEHKREIARHQRQAAIAAGTHAWRGRKPKASA